MLRALWNSNLIFSKGCLAAIDGCISAFEGGIDVSLVVLGRPVGDHICSPDVMIEEVMSRSSHPCMNFIGTVPSDEAHVFATMSDVVLLPSKYKSECQPLALISAMVSGCEIITCDTPALRWTLGSYPARFVDVDPIDIGLKLKKVSEEKLVTREDIWLARQRFSKKRFIKEMQDVLWGN